MKEIWKNIPNYEGYQVSNLGRIRTHNKTTYTKKHGIRNWKDRILHYKGDSYKTGYRVDLWKDGKPHTMLVARLVAFTFYNEDINNHKLTVDHVDGNRLNNNLKNLELVSLAENIRRSYDINLHCNQKNVILLDKRTNKEIKFRSLQNASLFMNRCHSYLHYKINKNQYENNFYKWKLV